MKPHDNTGLKAVLNLHTYNSKYNKYVGIKRALLVINFSRDLVVLLHVISNHSCVKLHSDFA